ncbi:hypothetical protein PITC_070800 [Penicillium italicum]|uniref:Uncharacterized protein n=1 Tax=Penicillium italicum TaxID=40296 RepID=A0A0A2KVR5_PENIT|nr:hypothetical protein PITC_070800 [Penicillium italicum]
MDRRGYHAGWEACLYVDWDSTLFPIPRFQGLSRFRRGEP